MSSTTLTYLPLQNLPTAPHTWESRESIASWELWSFQAHRYFLRLLLLLLGSELLCQPLSTQGPRGSSTGTKRLGPGSEQSPGTRGPAQDPETRRTQPGRRHLAEGGARQPRTLESDPRGGGRGAGSVGHVGGQPAGHVGSARSVRLRRPVAAAGAVAFGADAVSVWGSQAGAGKCRSLNGFRVAQLSVLAEHCPGHRASLGDATPLKNTSPPPRPLEEKPERRRLLSLHRHLSRPS